MDTRTIIYVIIGVFGAIIGVYVFLIRHLSATNKHPSSDKIVYKDVCEANRDCFETELKALKELMNQRFDSLEELIKNGGQPRGRVRT